MSKLDELNVIRTIGRGVGTKVKLVEDPKTGVFYAAKIVKSRDDSLLNYLREALLRETDSLSRINHPNVVSIVNWNGQGVYVKKEDRGFYECMYILMELCPNGELFDIISRTGKLSENVARGLFHQLINGLEACHNSQIVHNDLKCENILFDRDFNIKISDFGSCAILRDRDGQVKTKGKNEMYMAPEMHMLQPCNGELSDFFAAGVILFIMATKDPPFQRAILNDPYYKHLASHEIRFWKLHRKADLSNEFKNFIESLLAYDSSQRLNLASIKSHPWYNGPVANPNEISSELELRRQQAVIAAERAKQQRISAGENAGIIYNRGRFFRGDVSEAEELSLSFSYPADLLNTHKVCEKFNVVNKYSQFLTGLLPHEVMTILSHTLATYDSECEASTDSYKVKVSIVTEGDTLNFKVSILESENDLYLVLFKLESGNHFDFMPIFNAIVEKVNSINDKPIE